ASSPARDCASCNAGETCGVLGQGGLCAEQVNVCPDGTCDVPDHPDAQCVTDLSGNKICVIGSLAPCPCQGSEACIFSGGSAAVCAAVNGACDRNRTMFVAGRNAALSGRLSVLLRDPPSRTSTDPNAPKAQNDVCGTADPVTGGLVLSARD